MSGSVGLPSGPFTDAEKTDIRRYCGYPAYGTGQAGFQNWRFFQAYGTLEFRLNNLAAAEIQVVRRYLATLYGLEAAIPGAGDNLDTDKASVWTHNRDEVRDRSALFDGWCSRLANFMGIPTGPNFGGGSSNTVSLVV